MVTDGMPPKSLGLITTYYASIKTKVRTSGGDSMTIEFHPYAWQRCAPFSTIFFYSFDWNLCRAMQDTPGAQVEDNFHVSDPA